MSPARKPPSVAGNAVLGDLEERVMTALWEAAEPMTGREVWEVVVAKHEVAQITVITVCNRLAAKRLLKRKKRGAYLRYEAAVDRESFARRASHDVLRRLTRLGSRALSASIVDALAEYDPQQLEALGEIVRRKLIEAQPNHERDHDGE